VRRVALNTLNSVAHNKPQLVAAELQSILPLLYAETVFKVYRTERYDESVMSTSV
jgi:hypothetical protein